MISNPTPMTAEELLGYSAGHHRVELVRGQLVVREPASYRHGLVAGRVHAQLSAWLEQDRIARGADEPRGDVLAAETGFTLSRHPDTVRAPDVAYVRADRRPVGGRGFAELAPDLVVEVVPPADRPGAVLTKVADWLTAGTQVVWVIDPQRRTALHFGADGTVRSLGERDALRADPVLDGVEVPLAAVWGRW